MTVHAIEIRGSSHPIHLDQAFQSSNSHSLPKVTMGGKNKNRGQNRKKRQWTPSVHNRCATQILGPVQSQLDNEDPWDPVTDNDDQDVHEESASDDDDTVLLTKATGSKDDPK
jgi:hypothetical protein